MVRELPGRIAPTRVSEVRPRVSGIVVERSFRQGSEVKAGDPLYRIDPRPFEVEVQSSEAALAKAVAAFDQAAQQARRIATLTSQRATSEAENEKANGAMRQAEAEVEGRKAEVARARLNLSYATVRAPIDGVVGAALVSQEVADTISYGDHGSTYGGNLLACRAALCFLDELDTGGLLGRVSRVGDHLERGLRAMAARHPLIKEVRGAGLIWGLELTRDAAPVIKEGLARGVIVNRTAETVVRLLPPLVITEAEVDRLVSATRDAVKSVLSV